MCRRCVGVMDPSGDRSSARRKMKECFLRKRNERVCDETEGVEGVWCDCDTSVCVEKGGANKTVLKEL